MNKTEYRVGIGASSILMIFIILSLTTLGVLSFASARADMLLTARRQRQVETYYETVADAQRLLAEIDAALLTAQQDPDAYATHLEALASLDNRITVKPADMSISFALPAGDSLQLEVNLTATGADSPLRYTITGHQLVNIAAWQPDTSLNLKTEE